MPIREFAEVKRRMLRNMLVSPMYGWGRVEDQFGNAPDKGQFEDAFKNTWVNVTADTKMVQHHATGILYWKS